MTVVKIVPMPGVAVEGPQGPQGSVGPAGDSAYQIAVDNGFEGTEQQWLDSLGGNADTGSFTFVDNEMTTDGEMSIGVNGVPGSINLSAYSGIELSFADAPGAGLRFPDGTVQYTAYTGNGSADLVVPTAIKDQNNDDFIVFERTGTGTARIATPQDDLSLRSARDITLFAGNNGPGNVYIGWGDAVYTPDSPNRVATIGDLESSAKTWTAQNSSVYEIRQAHGGSEVSLAQPSVLGEIVTVSGNVENSQYLTVSVSTEMNAVLLDIWNNAQHFRNIQMDLGAQTRYFRINNPVDTNVWQLYVTSGPLTVYDQNQYWMEVQYGGAPVVWWDADTLGLMPSGDEWKFRGAKIEYHAYSTDSGTIIGTVYIADDSGDDNVTHIETSSGGSDTGNVILWNRSGGEQQLFAYRADNEDDTVKIHWTAQIYYGTEVYD